jgi:hypothetical protein
MHSGRRKLTLSVWICPYDVRIGSSGDVEGIDETVARPRFIIAFARGLLSVRDKNFAVEIADTKRRKVFREIWIDEPVWIHPIEILVERVHPTGMKIGRVKRFACFEGPANFSLVRESCSRRGAPYELRGDRAFFFATVQ